MHQVQVFDAFDPRALVALSRDFELVRAPQTTDKAVAALVRSTKLDAAAIRALGEGLEIIARAGAGTNTIDVATATQLGIPVVNTPGANANAVKELVLLMMLMAARNAVAAQKFVHTLRTVDRADYDRLIEGRKREFVGTELAGAHLGLVGGGAIGRMVAEAARSLGMSVSIYDPYLKDAHLLPAGVRVCTRLVETVATCDYVSLHLPLNDSTRGIFGETALGAMKPGAVLINAARPYVVDRLALKRALQEGPLGLYATDFPLPDVLRDEELADRILAFPHLGASTHQAQFLAGMRAANQAHDCVLNGNVVNAVNMPDCEVPYAPGTSWRLTMARDASGPTGDVSRRLRLAGIAACNVTVRSSQGKPLAYSVYDLAGRPGGIVVAGIQELPGVRRVRLIPAA